MIEQERRGDIAILRMAHGKANAMDVEMCDGIVATFAHMPPDVRAIVLTGTGSIFSAGVDLQKVLDGGVDYCRAFVPKIDRAFGAIFAYPRPVVAAINGHAIAGGAVMAAACDQRILASGKVRMGVPELAVGVSFPPLALAILEHQLAPHVVNRLTLMGDTPSPEEALALGLVDEVVDPDAVFDRAVAVAEQLARIPEQVFVRHKLGRRAAAFSVLHDEDRAQAAVDDWCSEPVLDSIRAYMDKLRRK